jgi:hypothetical protein
LRWMEKEGAAKDLTEKYEEHFLKTLKKVQ